MKRLRALLLMLVVVLAGSVANVGTAQAVETCHTINARGTGHITSQTTSGAITVSQIIGGGLLHGTTEAHLTFTSIDPTTGIATFEGTLVLTNKHGTLTLFVFNGVFNTQTGEFQNDSVVTDGTGRFAGATGNLFFHGFVAPDGSFTDDTIRGTVCVNLP
jgi:hypothetical protein